MAQGLARIGVSVDIATTDDDGKGRFVISSDQPIESGGYRIWQFATQTDFYRVSLPLARWLAQHITDYDLVHVHTLWSFAAIPAAFFAHRNHVPYVLSPHGAFSRWGMVNRRPLTKRLSYRIIEGRIVRNSSQVHYTAEQECVEASELGIDKTYTIVPLGIDLREYEGQLSVEPILRRYPELKGRYVILYLSRIDRKKGLDLLLAAFARIVVTHPQALLLVVGDGEPKFVQALKNQAKALRISDDVIWAGFLSGDEKLAAYAVGDVFALPSSTENFGIVVVEAMASRLPVIISNEVAIAPEVSEAGAGLVVEPSVEAVSTALENILGEPKQRQIMGSNGCALAEEKFSQKVMAGSLFRMYQSVLEG